MRRLIEFPCAGETLLGTLDAAPGDIGLLIVSGGNEVRCGAHRGQALLAQRLAVAGVPVFRFDRRGIGDSSGENAGWEGSAPDLSAAAAAFRREAGVRRILGFGNCDAATALTLFGGEAGIERLVLANPWVVEDAGDGLPPAAAIRARYVQRLRDPGEWIRLLRGGVDLRKLAGGLAKLLRRRDGGPLAARVTAAIGRWRGTTLVLASRDATALAFADATRDADFAARIVTVDTASHSFAGPDAQDALFETLLAALASARNEAPAASYRPGRS